MFTPIFFPGLFSRSGSSFGGGGGSLDSELPPVDLTKAEEARLAQAAEIKRAKESPEWLAIEAASKALRKPDFNSED